MGKVGSKNLPESSQRAEIMKFVLLLVAFVACVAAKADIAMGELEQTDVVKGLPEQLPPTKAAGNARKDFLSRTCLNQCGGLCRQLCAKFKALKVCNGCVRGCLNKCYVGPGPKVTYDPFNIGSSGNATRAHRQ